MFIHRAIHTHPKHNLRGNCVADRTGGNLQNRLLAAEAKHLLSG